MDDRGIILHEPRLKQIVSFKGMRYGTNITPTDVDGMIEYQNKAYVWFDVKHGDKPVPFGQRLAMERFVRDMAKAGKHSVAIIAEHYIDDPNQHVIAATTIVREVFFDTELVWRPTYRTPLTLDEAIKLFIECLEVKNCESQAS